MEPIVFLEARGTCSRYKKWWLVGRAEKILTCLLISKHVVYLCCMIAVLTLIGHVPK